MSANSSSETKKDRYIRYYFKAAQAAADMSYATRKKVGAVLVKDLSIIGEGWNGTPSGFPNSCEEHGETRPEVIHAEFNAIAKVARSSNSTAGADLYVTYSPCFNCAKLIVQSGIKKLYYTEMSTPEPLAFLKKCGIDVEQITL